MWDWDIKPLAPGLRKVTVNDLVELPRAFPPCSSWLLPLPLSPSFLVGHTLSPRKDAKVFDAYDVTLVSISCRHLVTQPRSSQ